MKYKVWLRRFSSMNYNPAGYLEYLRYTRLCNFYFISIIVNSTNIFLFHVHNHLNVFFLTYINALKNCVKPILLRFIEHTAMKYCVPFKITINC